LNVLKKSYKIESFSKVENLIAESLKNNSTNPSTYLFLKPVFSNKFKIGVTFRANKGIDVLKEEVLDSLAKVKYSNNEYIIINTFDGYALLSRGKKQIPPINILNSGESNWKEIFKKQLEYAKKPEGGYYTYFWRNRISDERSEKTSYFSGIHEWGWVIGTGFFTNNIDPIIAKLNSELWKDIMNNLLRFAIFLVILSFLAYLTMRYYALKAKSNILLFLHFFKRAAQGMQIIDSSKLAFTEFEALAQAANQMIHERERIKAVLSAEKSRLRYMIDAIP